MKVINWPELDVSDRDLALLQQEFTAVVQIDQLVRTLVRNFLCNPAEWEHRADSIPVYNPGLHYTVGDKVALPTSDPDRLHSNTWKIAQVINAEVTSNPIQGDFQAIELEINGRTEWFAAGVTGAQPLTFEFSPPDEVELDWQVSHYSQEYAAELRQIVFQLLETGRLQGQLFGDQVLFGDYQSILRKEERYFLSEISSQLEQEQGQVNFVRLLEKLRELSCLEEYPDDISLFLISKWLEEEGFLRLGKEIWVSPDQWEKINRPIDRRVSVPRIRSKTAQERDEDDSQQPDEAALREDPDYLKDLEDAGEGEIPPAPTQAPWQQPTRPIRLPSLTYLHLSQAYFPLNGELGNAFDPSLEQRLVYIQVIDGEHLQFLVSRQAGVVKALDRDGFRNKFEIEKNIPAGTILWLEYQGNDHYRLAPRPLPAEQRVHCKLLWLDEERKLRIDEIDIPVLYEHEENLVKSEIRFSDLDGLQQEAEQSGLSIFDTIYRTFQELSQDNPGIKLHHKEVFNLVFFRHRSCSPYTVIQILYTRPCFVPEGDGYFSFDPEGSILPAITRHPSRPVRRPPTAPRPGGRPSSKGPVTGPVQPERPAPPAGAQPTPPQDYIPEPPLEPIKGGLFLVNLAQPVTDARATLLEYLQPDKTLAIKGIRNLYRKGNTVFWLGFSNYIPNTNEYLFNITDELGGLEEEFGDHVFFLLICGHWSQVLVISPHQLKELKFWKKGKTATGRIPLLVKFSLSEASISQRDWHSRVNATRAINAYHKLGFDVRAVTEALREVYKLQEANKDNFSFYLPGAPIKTKDGIYNNLFIQFEESPNLPRGLNVYLNRYWQEPSRENVLHLRQVAHEQIRSLLDRSNLADLTLDAFNTSVWQLGTIVFEGRRIPVSSKEYIPFVRNQKGLVEAWQSGKVRITGNQTWGSATWEYGAMLSMDTAHKERVIRSTIMSLLYGKEYSTLLLNYLIREPNGFGLNALTGILHVMVPEKFILFNTRSASAAEKLGFVWYGQWDSVLNFRQYVDFCQWLLETYPFRSFTDVDWFMYCLDIGLLDTPLPSEAPEPVPALPEPPLLPTPAEEPARADAAQEEPPCAPYYLRPDVAETAGSARTHLLEFISPDEPITSRGVHHIYRKGDVYFWLAFSSYNPLAQAYQFEITPEMSGLERQLGRPVYFLLVCGHWTQTVVLSVSELRYFSYWSEEHIPGTPVTLTIRPEPAETILMAPEWEENHPLVISQRVNDFSPLGIDCQAIEERLQQHYAEYEEAEETRFETAVRGLTPAILEAETISGISFWEQVSRLLGSQQHTLDQQSPFQIIEITEKGIRIQTSTGEQRRIARHKLEDSWAHLVNHGSLTRAEIQKLYAPFDPAYVAAILAAMPGVQHAAHPIRLTYPASSPNQAVPPPVTPTEPEKPPFEHTGQGQGIIPGMPLGPIFDQTPAPTPTHPARIPKPREDMQNKTLFSRHFLEQRLPNLPEWAEDSQHILQGLLPLWRSARQLGATWNEYQTEEEFVKPLLNLLGWEFIVQPKAGHGGKVTRPDYALFANKAAKKEAQPLQGNDKAFYSKALAIAEAKHWERPLSKQDDSQRATWKANSNPSYQMVSYLVGTHSPWGILTNGRTWRLYSREVSSTASEYYEVDLGEFMDVLAPPETGQTVLPTLAPQQAADAFQRWWLFFRKTSFTPDAQGKCFVQRVLEGSTLYARDVSDKLKELVFKEVMPEIAGGYVAYRKQVLKIEAEDEASLKEIYQASLSLLYKLLFLLYAEARALLPVDNPAYRAQSLTEMALWAADAHDKAHSLSRATYATPKYDALLALFRRLDQGDPGLGIPHYNGGLFSPASPENAFIEKHRLSDWAVAQTIDLLVRDAGQPVDYAYISVRNLGAIYEGLLENKLQVLDAAAGKVALINDKGERKATGSYYTPDYIVEYIVENTLDPILDARQAEYEQAMGRVVELRIKLEKTADPAVNRLLQGELEEAGRQAREAFLGIKVLDPAMGSGHFLVNAVDHLTDGIIQRMQAYHDTHPEARWEWDPIQQLIVRVRSEILDEMATQGLSVDPRRLDDTALLTRLVMKRCIYGVDLNRMAVELAKVSLWLHSFTIGAPLSFLDHHLRWGNSLIGADVRTVEKAMRGQMQQDGAMQLNLFGGPFSGLLDLASVMTDVAERADATLADVRQSSENFESFQKSLIPYKQALDLWISQYFGNKDALDFLTFHSSQVLPALRGESPSLSDYQGTIENAHKLWLAKRFFHWDLEFPEIFIDLRKRDWAQNPGFDAIIGNPPYIDSEVMSYSQPDIRNYCSEHWKSASGNWDLFVIFVELGVKFTKVNGFSSLILPNKLIGSEYCRVIQSILQNKRVRIIRDYSDVRVFESNVYPIVYVVENIEGKPDDLILISKMRESSDNVEILWEREVPLSILSKLPEGYWWPLFSDAYDILNKVLSVSQRLDKLAEVVGAATVSEAYEIASILEEAKPRSSKLAPGYCKFINTGTIDRYTSLWMSEATSYLKERYEQPIVSLVQLEKISAKRLTQASSPKIIVGGMSINLEAFCDLWGEYLAGKSTVIILNSSVSSGYLLSILNSKLGSLIYRELFGSLALQGGYLRIGPPQIQQLPICNVNFITPSDAREKEFARVQALYITGNLTGVLTFVHQYLPIHTDIVHDLLNFLAEQMIALNKERQDEVKGFLTWLEHEIGMSLDDLTGKSNIQNYLGDYQKGEEAASLAQILDVLKKNQKKLAVDVSGRAFQERLAKEYQASLDKLLPIKQKLAATDRLIDQIVYKLYGLTEEEIAIVEGKG